MTARRTSAIAPSATERRAARVAGLAYLVAIPPAVFAEFAVLGRLIAGDDAAATARNVLANEQLFRLGTASNVAVFALDVVLIVALYVTLRPVSSTVALVALCWRMIETSLLVVATLSDLEALRLLRGASYLLPLPLEARHALARSALEAHGATYNLALVFAGLGTAAFCWSWLQSRWVPKVLAGFGLAAAVVLSVCTLAFIIRPGLHAIVPVAIYGGPIFVFELVMGWWLLWKGLRPAR
jgi:Domain of unknown function (DUF4386)